MRIIVNIGTVLFVSLTILSCGTPTPPVSTVKSNGFSCDLQSSAAASNDASNRAFQCAYNSLKSAGKLAGGGIVTDVANIVDGVKQVYDGSIAARELFNDLNEFIRTGGQLPIDLKDAAKDNQKTLEAAKSEFEKTEFGKQLSRKAMYRCLDGNYRAVKDFVSLTGMASGLRSSSQGSSTLSFSEIQSLGSLGFSGIRALLDRMKTLSECSQWLSGSRGKSLVQLSQGVKQITSSLDIAMTLARCGVDLAYGGYVLYSNSACLVGDIQSYYEGRASLDRQRQNNQNTTIAQQDRVGESLACMDRYGTHLYYNGPGEFYNTRAYMCALYCGNKGRRVEYASANLNAIFANESNRSMCAGVARDSQDKESVNICLSSCCDQTATCKDSAWEKLKYYDL